MKKAREAQRRPGPGWPRAGKAGPSGSPGGRLVGPHFRRRTRDPQAEGDAEEDPRACTTPG